MTFQVNNRFITKGDPPRCKWCPEPVRANRTPAGRNKGWYRTCGSQECLTRSYRDPDVSKKKKCNKDFVCEFCKTTAVATGNKQRWCTTCVPDKAARSIAQRYGMSKNDWLAMVKKQNGTCALCDRQPRVVDHCHTTGKVRGVLCVRCNLLVAGLDADPAWVARASSYLSK